MTAKKYEIVKNDSIVHRGKTLYRIRALKDFWTVPAKMVYKGDLGGYVESENNLSQEGNCWISGKAKVYDDAKIFDNAYVYGAAEVFDKAEISDYSQIYDNAIVSGAAWIFGNARIYGNAKICEKAQIYGNAEVKGNVFIYGDSKVCGVAKISGNKKVETGKYIVKSLNIDEVFNEIKPVCDKINFINKAINSNFPVEENYIKSLISQFAEYSELADFFYIHGCIGFTSKEMGIYDLLLQCRKIYEKLKVKIDK